MFADFLGGKGDTCKGGGGGGIVFNLIWSSKLVYKNKQAGGDTTHDRETIW